MHDSPKSKAMKRSTLVISLLSLTALTLLQSTLGQAPNTTPLEASATQESAAPTTPADVNAARAKAEAGTTLTTTPQSYVSAPDQSNLQEQLKWAEQRASEAEDHARATQSNIPLLILVILFAIPLAFAGGVFFARYKNYQQLNETVRALIEKGVSIPPEMLTPNAPKGPAMSDFRKGLLLIWSGIGAAFLLGIVIHGSRAWSLSLIPIFTGLAYLVLWRLERRKATA